MKVAILGTGMVGDTLATALVARGVDLMMGSRSAQSEGAQKWLASVQNRGKAGTFAEAAAFGEIAFNCTNGANSLAAIQAAGVENLRGKILVDVANPLEFSDPQHSTLTVCNTDSLGEQLQRALPETRVVKAFNTINCQVMINPSALGGEHHLFICGNDASAKQTVAAKLAEWFGWQPAQFVDLGDITAARATEMYLPLWLRLMGTLRTPMFSVRVVRG